MKNIVHVVGTGTIGEPLIGLFTDFRDRFWIDEVTFHKNTPLQDSFGYNMVSLVDGVPRTLNVAEMIGYYLDHQMEVVERRTQFRLDQAEARAHILEGLIVAVDSIDEVIKIIRGSADTAEARGL